MRTPNLQLSSSSQYDAEQVARFLDVYGIREWNRRVQGPVQEASLYIHTHYLEKYVRAGQHVLEIGAGAERCTQILARLGVRIVVGDLSQVQLDLNKQHAAQYDFVSAIEDWVQIDICDMSRCASESFDYVVAYGGLRIRGLEPAVLKALIREILSSVVPARIIDLMDCP